jgi:hypothetical protein
MPRDRDPFTEQALAALGELVEGFNTARARSGAAWFAEELANDRTYIHGSVLAALMRIVFLLHAEDRGLLPRLLTSLHERLHDADAWGRGAMEERYGAWAEVLSIFSVTFFGARDDPSRLPARGGELFDPKVYPYLDRARVSDGVFFRALNALLFVGGTRISYRALDVEHIGRVYEAMMGYTLEVAGSGAWYLQPTAARRRSGSHYTPRELAEPIVRKTFEPILARLEENPGGPRAADLLALKVCDPATGSGAFLLEACRQLASEVVRAWKRRPEDRPPIPPDEDDELHARRLVAKQCLYGVDKNPFAVALAKLSSWLVTEAKEQPFTFLDATLRVGDSLVERAFSRDVTPLGWEAEFPEVFSRENPGFDGVVGNPPFLGGSRISSTLGKEYLDYLLALHPGAHGNGDLVAHFFRRAFGLLRQGGTLGMLATSTIAEGDTRRTGLDWICRRGGTIYAASRGRVWPGIASVVVSTVHLVRGGPPALVELDGRAVPRISSFLFGCGGDEPPSPLSSNARLCFVGAKIYGQGFVFDDADGGASPLSEMRAILAEDPRAASVILPYLGGEELNTHPRHAHHRFVIHFGKRTEAEARAWPSLMSIVEGKVKPERERLADNPDGRRRKRFWWQWGRYTPALYEAIRTLDRVLACSLHTKEWCLAFVPTRMAFSHALGVFVFSTWRAFALLQSRVHEVWARFFCSSLGGTLRYTPSDGFETFPFPPGWEENERLDGIGKEYYEHRAALMVRNDQGFTATYNRFHDPAEADPGIHRLRELRDVMDRAVLEAYGWPDIEPSCTFLLDHEGQGETRKKKSWRYRWSDDVREEVLARLVALNKERAAGRAFTPRGRE